LDKLPSINKLRKKMDYLSEYYKNKCQILSSKKLQLENQVKILKFKTFLIEGGMVANKTEVQDSDYTPQQNQAGIFDDLWKWWNDPRFDLPGSPPRPTSPPTTPTAPTPRPPKPERPWRPNQKPGESSPHSPAGPDGRPRPKPGLVPPGPPHGVPPAKQRQRRDGGRPETVEPNPRQAGHDERYYFLASDGTVYRWNPSTGQWDRYIGTSSPWGPTYDGTIPGVQGNN
jgi:hypothetical protein